jgi:polysaccharide deacetylase family protein (PEP-CTERM system associated)
MVPKVKTHPSVITIDVEDGLSLAMRDLFNKPLEQTERCVRTTHEILDVLEDKDVKATFFTLGIVGEKFPELVKEIVNRGHELAVHGHKHLKFFEMTPELALEELTKAKDILEQISGVEITGHRAPAFSISKNTPWAFDVIIEAGFKYDSSIMPIQSKYYGWHDFPKEITTVKTSNGTIEEFPISVFEKFGKQFPFSGGSYFRFLPIYLTKKMIRNTSIKKPCVIYFHPYEFDRVRYPEFYFEELEKQDFKTRLKLRTNFLNRNKSKNKLIEIIKNNEFKTMSEVIKNYSRPNNTYLV